jgi:hypothetical protein
MEMQYLNNKQMIDYKNLSVGRPMDIASTTSSLEL